MGILLIAAVYSRMKTRGSLASVASQAVALDQGLACARSLFGICTLEASFVDYIRYHAFVCVHKQLSMQAT